MTNASINTAHHLPSGTVTFLFTDIEGSTRLWHDKPEAMTISHARHDELMREAIELNNGYIFQIVGDSFSAAFHNARDGVNACIIAQRGLQTEAWGESGAIKVRMGLHTGAAQISDNGNYVGYTTIASAQRVMSVAYGGQALVSQSTHELLQNDLPEGTFLRDMGEHRLKDLRSPLRLYQLIAPGLEQNFPMIKSLNHFPNNLPIQLTSFIGRDREIAAIKGFLETTRLVTLTGSGGTGKSRLSQEIGAQLPTDFPHGVWLIELAPLSDESQIIPALAQVLGLQETSFNPLANVVLDYLRDKKLLLILDNCEHLIVACARLADHLLHNCAGLKILASSRELLGIAGETAFRTPSLADSESTRLFVERARTANPNFHMTDANNLAIIQICHRLDGIPLAIELAAARSKLLSPEQIAARLDDMFRLLIGGSRTALPRQQTLRSLIDWSYDLLSDEEKRLLQFSSVFVGGWTLDALEFVADDPQTLDLLEQLVNKSLVVTEEREGEMRYFMLETIRQYAREKLFEAKQAALVRERHFIFFDLLSEERWGEYLSGNILLIINRSANEVENFRVALEWGLVNKVNEAIRLAANLCIILEMLGKLTEGMAHVKSAIDCAKAQQPEDISANLDLQKLIGRAYFALSNVCIGLGDMALSAQASKEAIAISCLAGDKWILGYSLLNYFTASTFLGLPDGDDAAREGLVIFEGEVDNRLGLGMAYLAMAQVSARNGDDNEKKKYFGKLREITSAAPDSMQSGLLLFGMGWHESQQGNYDLAKQIFEDAVTIFNRLHYTSYRLIMQSESGHLARHTGDFEKAKSIYQGTIQGWLEIGNRSAIAHQLECFGFLAISDDDARRAAELFGAAEALREKVVSPMADYEQVEYEQFIAQLRTMLTEAELNAAWTEGRSKTMQQAIEFALGSDDDEHPR